MPHARATSKHEAVRYGNVLSEECEESELAILTEGIKRPVKSAEENHFIIHGR
jgi:hypothetical protein